MFPFDINNMKRPYLAIVAKYTADRFYKTGMLANLA